MPEKVKIPAGLFERIMARLKKEHELLSIKKRLFIFSVGSGVFFLATILCFLAVKIEFNQNAFFQFFSLIFSDFSTITIYWKNFILTLLERLPVSNLTVLLTAILGFNIFLKLLLKNIKQFFSIKNLLINI
ncbi:MAG: hypothetical protein PHE77_03595 [Candidatus Pacebacteria bacterium]|nr:hypothetical protein [Candidatus Paceibacterota bacterium]